MCPCGVANTCNCFLATERESSADELQRLRAEVAYCVCKENELREANTALTKRNLVLQADARRYRWLREDKNSHIVATAMYVHAECEETLDATIDRFMEATIDSAIEEAKK